MTKFNGFQHDGFGGFRSCGYNARNGPVCYPTDRVAVNLSGGTSVYTRTPSDGVLWSSSGRPMLGWDNLGRLWVGGTSGETTCKCYDKDGTLLFTSLSLGYRPIYGVAGNNGRCYATYFDSVAGAWETACIASDGASVVWTRPHIGYTTFDYRVFYSGGYLYAHLDTGFPFSYDVEQIDVSDGSLVRTLTGLPYSAAPAGGVVLLDQATSVAERYDNAGSVVQSFPAGIVPYYMTSDGGLMGGGASGAPGKLYRYLADGTFVERHFNTVYAQQWVSVIDCDPTLGGSRDVFIGGTAREATPGDPLEPPQDGLNHSLWVTDGTEVTTLSGWNVASGNISKVMINGEWSVHT